MAWDVATYKARFRSDLDDEVARPLWSDPEFLGYLNSTLDDACVRALLIEDEDTECCCRITLIENEPLYALHKSVIRVKEVRFANLPLRETSKEEETQRDNKWRTRTGKPQRFILSEAGKIRLVPKPNATIDGDQIELTVYRRQLIERTLAGSASSTGAPEIPADHHEHILDGMYARAYLKKDAETINKAKSEEHEALFTSHFGVRIDANVQRKQRDRRPPVTRFRFP